MRIGIDARELIGKRTGVGRYLANLCAIWKLLPPHGPHLFKLYGPLSSRDPSVLGFPFNTGTPGPFSYHEVPGNGNSWWGQTRLASAIHKDRLDVFFAPAYSAPLLVRVPVVLTIHDVSFEAHPEWFSLWEGLSRRLLTRQASQFAKRIITVSEFTRDEAVKHLGISPRQISVIRSGIHSPLRFPEIPREPLVLFAGSIFNRRHVPSLIKAFAWVAEKIPTARLCLVGDNRSYPRENLEKLAVEAGIANKLTIRPYIDEEELAGLYARAMVFVFLSEYEGFGFPPLEAMAAGVPPVVGDTPVAREIYLDAVRRVNVHDIQAIAANITELLENHDMRQELLSNAADLLPQFTWERASRETLSILEGARA